MFVDNADARTASLRVPDSAGLGWGPGNLRLRTSPGDLAARVPGNTPGNRPAPSPHPYGNATAPGPGGPQGPPEAPADTPELSLRPTDGIAITATRGSQEAETKHPWGSCPPRGVPPSPPGPLEGRPRGRHPLLHTPAPTGISELAPQPGLAGWTCRRARGPSHPASPAPKLPSLFASLNVSQLPRRLLRPTAACLLLTPRRLLGKRRQETLGSPGKGSGALGSLRTPARRLGSCAAPGRAPDLSVAPL